MENKLFVAMSHPMTAAQKAEFEGKIRVSSMYRTQNMKQIDPKLTSDEVRQFAELLITEARLNGCTHAAIQGEPALTWHAWNLAKEAGLTVLQATTHREVKEERNPYTKKIEKTSIFHHVQWREV